MPDERKIAGLRRLTLSIWSISLLAVVTLWLAPVSYHLTQVIAMGLLFLLWGGALVLWWKNKFVRVLCCLSALAVIAVLFLPGRPPDVPQLRKRYTESLIAYEKTTYVWGGENRLGIDCSGLVRRGLIDALIGEGITTFNPELIRQGLSLRWFDCSANALRQEYRGQTRHLFHATSIREVDHAQLHPGDFAITADGVHALAYLGDKTWIEADPGAGHVVQVKATEE